jgi:serine/threonine protein phosphatase 1
MTHYTPTRRFAISDIHGCLRTFRYMVEEVLQLVANDALYLLGDYIDRGPNSKGVIDYIAKMQDRGIEVFCLLGNHEYMLLQSRLELRDDTLWLRNGGEETLLSFGVSQSRNIPEKYVDLFRSMAYYIELPDYVLVHAGFALHEPDPLLNHHAHLWLRPPSWYDNLAQTRFFGDKIVVHGHTPIVQLSTMIDSLKLDKYPAINIDAGCVFGGYLCALDLDKREMIFQHNME